MTARSETRRLFEVRVEDLVDERLLGRRGCRYRSPAHTPEQAAALVQALIGVPPAAADVERGQSWSTATAGGRRVVTVTPLAATSSIATGGQR